MKKAERMLQRATFFVLHSLFIILLLAACSSGDDAGQGEEPATGRARVTLRIGAGAEQTTTRAWQDANAKTDRSEMMYSWHVIIVNSSNEVVFEKSNTSVANENAEIDIVAEDVELAVGQTYTAYSFANMEKPSLTGIETATYTVNGNGFTPSETNGIPMSNKQTFTITEGQTEQDLIVVRMLAKMKISVKNETGAATTIKYATLSGVTDNVANNLKLLPKWTTTTGSDNMDVTQHGDLQPNLNGTPATTEFSIPGLASATELANNDTREVTFYVNESAKNTEFMLTIGLGNNSSTSEYRYALIDQKGATSDDDNMWDYIARNDYRIIPITLDDYHFQLIPYDFPPIGVYPVSVKALNESQNLYEFTFHDYGHFHLLPQVTKGSGATATTVPFGTAEGETRWTLTTDWTNTWKTSATKGGSWLDATGVNSNGFYRVQATPDAVDGDEAGGVPLWYANTSAPQWSPSGSSSYAPFIFGYIAEPPADWWSTPAIDRADRQIYHEMKIKLYVNGQYRRDMLYRFYMTLSKDQMLGAPRQAPLRHAAPRHTHNR